LLTSGFVARRMDSGAVVEEALELAARGWGCRRIAARLGRPCSTVRGWVAAARRESGPVWDLASALTAVLGPAPCRPRARW
jgi:hypothetical protein